MSFNWNPNRETLSKMILPLLVALAFLIVPLVAIDTAESTTQVGFASGVDKTVTFSTKGVDGTTVYTVPTGITVSSATMNVTTSADENGDYCLYPSIDFGGDGDTEWGYHGPGYGEFGHQDHFTTNTTSETSQYTGAAELTTSHFYLPADATVSDADIGVKGRFVNTGVSDYLVGAGGLKNPWRMDHGDIDGDGDDDVALTSYDYYAGKVVWFECPSNPTSASQWSMVVIAEGLRYPYDVQIADIDEDGANDVVVSLADYSTGAVYWYRNVNGDGSSWTRYTIKTGLRQAAEVRVGDIDGDGDPDVAVAACGYYSYYTSSYNVVWYEAPANPTGTWTQHGIYRGTSYYYGYIYGFDMADIDKDGDLDVAWAHRYGSYHIYVAQCPSNPKGTNSWSTNLVGSNQIYYPENIRIGDVDGDTWPDIVAASSYYSSNNNAGVKWFRNDGTPWSGTYTRYIIHQNLRTVYGLEVGQVDGSNGIDVVVTSYYSGATYLFYTSNPTGGAWSQRTVHTCTYPRALELADIDNDGNMDVCDGSYSTGQVWFNENAGTGNGASWDDHTIEPGGLKSPYGCYADDVDGDGDNDTVVAAYGSNKIYWYENDGTPANGKWPAHIVDNNANSPYDVIMVDIDDDGDNDIVATHYSSSSLYWYDNNGAQPPVWTRRTITTSLQSACGLASGDIDGDGNVDIAATSYYYGSAAIRWYEAPDDPTNSWSAHNIDTSANRPFDIELGDIDDDGDLDAAVTFNDYSSGQLNWYECPADPNSATSWTKHQLGSSLRYPYGVEIVDIDWDGDLDLVYTQMYYHVKWVEAPDDPTQVDEWEFHTINTGGGYMYPRGLRVKDIGDDGYWDVVITDYYGAQVLWFEEPDNPHTQTWTKHTVDSNFNYGWGVDIADFDGDQLMDIIATSYNQDEVDWWKLSVTYPSNVQLDIGDDGDNEWTEPASFKGKSSADITAELNSIIAAPPAGVVHYIDGWGNHLLRIPINTYSASIGKVTAYDLDIHYNWTTQVHKNNHNGNLTVELNELIPEKDTGDMDFRIMINSNSPGQLTISDLKIEYNTHPEMTEDIPTLTVNEDTIDENLLDVRQYFEDDYDHVDDLTYSIIQQDGSEDYVQLSIVDDYFIKADATQKTNWYGLTWARIYAYDNGGDAPAGPLGWYSNEFKVVVKSVNDEPFTDYMSFQSITMDEGTVDKSIDMDEGKYFDDIENDILYYDAVVDPLDEMEGEDLDVYVDEENRLVVNAMGDWYGNSVRVRVYCDDDLEFNHTINPYQDTFVTVQNVPDDPPIWSSVPPIVTEEDVPVDRAVYLPDYVTDIDTPLNRIDFTVVSNENASFISVAIDYNNYLSVYPATNFVGVTTVTLRASDGNNHGDTTFLVSTTPVNDPPIMYINSPTDGSEVTGKVQVVGFVRDPEGVDKVEVRFTANGQPGVWLNAIGTENWGIMHDFSAYEPGSTVLVEARTSDGEYSSNVATINVTTPDVIGNLDTDFDGVLDINDRFPNDPTEWADSDNDGYGDNTDKYPFDKTEHDDRDGDDIPDNKDQYPDDPNNGLVFEHPEVEEDTTDAGMSLPNMLAWVAVIALFLVLLICVLLYVARRYRAKHPKRRYVKEEAEAAEE